MLPLLLTVCSPAFACSDHEEVRELRMVNINNGEELDVVYFKDGKYLNEGVFEVSRFMRDRRTGEIMLIDTALMDLLYDLHTASGSNQPYRFYSGYRTKASNRAVGGGKESQHLYGKAADITLWDVPVRQLYNLARNLSRGGVGLYDKFVHIDVGKPRSW